jgi:dibenzofuran dioxygenase subunit alpha
MNAGPRLYQDPSARVDLAGGRIGRDVYFDRAIYERELEAVFGRSWLVVAHESQLRRPNDFVTQYMGEDPVLVTRDPAGRIRVFLNSCTHRGMKICREESGNAKTFECPYHGWGFDTAGRLVAVPYEPLAYGAGFERDARALHEAPRVDTCAGFVFASWDPYAVPLATWLGELRWYLELMAARQLGTLEVLPGQQRYKVAGNWKVAAENFAGDNYHTTHTHASALITGALPPIAGGGVDYTVSFPFGHGTQIVPAPGSKYPQERAYAETLGADAMDYLAALREKLEREVTPLQADVFALGVSNIFPNFSFNDFSVFHASTLIWWHPRGPAAMEVWQALTFDSQAPRALRDHVLRLATGEQAVSGFFGQDDVENIEQVTAASRGVVSRRVPFDYTMGLGAGPLSGVPLPGAVYPSITEQNQRNFYAQWLACMEGAPARG